MVGVCTLEGLFLCADHEGRKKSHKIYVLKGNNGVGFGNVMFLYLYV